MRRIFSIFSWTCLCGLLGAYFFLCPRLVHAQASAQSQGELQHDPSCSRHGTVQEVAKADPPCQCQTKSIEADPEAAVDHGHLLERAWRTRDSNSPNTVEILDDKDVPVSDEEVIAVVPSSEVQKAIQTLPIRYVIEKILVKGNERTSENLILSFVYLEKGDVLNVDDPKLEDVRWKLFGTGWFSDVHFALKRGSKKGWVNLVITVQERNTFVFQQVGFGISEGLSGSTDQRSDIVPYLNFALSESNFLGYGVELSLTALLSIPQQGFRLDFNEPFFLGSPQSIHASLGFNNARQFFGTDPLVSISCPIDSSDCPSEVKDGKNAVVFYQRTSFGLGTGREWPNFLRYKLGWHGDIVDVLVKPDSASERRGEERRPINFSILNGRSFVSMVEGQIVYERTNNPAFPSEGIYFQFQGNAASKIFGSDYNFFRLQSRFKWWIPTYKGQSVQLDAFLGAVFGDAPFFYQFHIADFSDFIPDRVLEMNLDRRPSPNFLNTAIRVMRNEKSATSLSVQYNFPVYRGFSGIRAVNTYGRIGVFLLADHHDFVFAVPGYEGASKAPLDLTFDFGAQLDTDIGVFKFGFSNLLGLISF